MQRGMRVKDKITMSKCSAITHLIHLYNKNSNRAAVK